MKLILPFLLFSLINCNSQQADEISYLVQSRGYYSKITVTETILIVQKERNETTAKSFKISKEQWRELQTLVGQIEVGELSNLKTSTQGQQVDAAHSAQLSVRVGSATYESNSFDSNNPPEKISKLLAKLLQLSDNVE